MDSITEKILTEKKSEDFLDNVILYLLSSLYHGK